ncbi:hypothetical protein CTEN210_01033 [Chaetoceros tenuissimus]|uniref:Protein kinase domain-containing protein n=1 Tax=Chaetoceros tenuissimus TaxID=426638 RepID=A0AAD3CF94_9STRA|nr:hypothetical protein CTEN210_01033 [Chaetoceros tenuissimus]
MTARPDTRGLTTNNRDSLMIQQHAEESLENLQTDSNLFHKSLSEILMLRNSQIQLGNTLGKGGFGEVKSIPLKKIRGSVIESDIAEDAIVDLAKEAKFLRALSFHPYIIKIHSNVGEIGKKGFGIVIDKLQHTLQYLIHTEWKVKHNSLNKSKFMSRRYVLTPDQQDLQREQLILLCKIVSAFVFLHEHNVLFRDIKPQNIGIGFDNVPRVFDFGLARELKEFEKERENQYLLTPCCGTRRYQPLEVINGFMYGLPYDVYSFTLMTWECLAMEVPYKEMNLNKHAMALQKNIRPKMKRYWNKDLRELLELGWNRDPNKRCTMKEVERRLQQMFKDLYGNETDWV